MEGISIFFLRIIIKVKLIIEVIKFHRLSFKGIIIAKSF